jgi:hypothetical protein
LLETGEAADHDDECDDPMRTLHILGPLASPFSEFPAPI